MDEPKRIGPIGARLAKEPMFKVIPPLGGFVVFYKRQNCIITRMQDFAKLNIIIELLLLPVQVL